jgi:hypothetical protein
MNEYAADAALVPPSFRQVSGGRALARLCDQSRCDEFEEKPLQSPSEMIAVPYGLHAMIGKWRF